MKRKSVLAMVSGLAALGLAATCVPALAYGHHGHHGDMQYGMLAHAAGLTQEQIHSAFKGDTALKTDFQNLKSAKKAMDTCIIAGNCTSGANGQVATFANAQAALTQEKMNVWQGLFATAPNKAQAVSLQSQLDNLKAQKHALMHQMFSSNKGTDSVTPPAAQQ